jgi:16S rRNA (adenine1518-N6/adenine1519-N6)-dimethyltransferase
VTPPDEPVAPGRGATGEEGVSAPGRLRVARVLADRGLRPDTDLGQHFLLDENLVDLAVREARLGPEDVVLEVGAGLGVLTVALARAARTVHAVEVDRRLLPALEEAVAGAGDVRLHPADAMRLALEALDPPPTRLVANLPYAIATPLVLESLWRLPGVARWTVMVQREVADRWLAPPGTRLYGVPSVLVALTARPRSRRSVGREVFLPRPRVDSALLTLERTAPGPAPATRALVRAGFAARRKTLANALAGAGADKARVAAALAARGLPASARPETIRPEVWPGLAEELDWPA